jgi:hypothetical protein
MAVGMLEIKFGQDWLCLEFITVGFKGCNVNGTFIVT